MDGWLKYSPRAPRRQARQGVRATARRGEIGESWWSKRFLSFLESLSISNRLSRGRSYARSGQVSELSVTGAWVTARVQGSARKPYEVWIQVPRWSDAQWEHVEEALTGEARLLAALLSGEMPADIEDTLAAAGLSLFPESRGELGMDCSCPDYASPCKHTAATFYILAEAFDRDPFLIFEWRGRPRERLLEGLRRRRARLAGAGARDPQALPATVAEYWGDAVEAKSLRFEHPVSESPDALLRALDPAPVYTDGSDVTEILAAAYREVSESAARRGRGD